MSILYLGTDVELLAGKLAQHYDQHVREDCFRPLHVVVPNRFLGKWLKLWLARKLGVAINLHFLYLENALWDMLRAVDPREHAPAPELVDADSYRLMVLAVLLENDPKSELAPLRDYLHGSEAQGSRASARRCWHLADRLASLIRDYEYHRQDVLIQPWLQGELGMWRQVSNLSGGQVGNLPPQDNVRKLERSQMEVFQAVVRLPDGKRALLGRAEGKTYKTLPQYAMEVMEVCGHIPPSPLWGEGPEVRGGPVHGSSPHPQPLSPKGRGEPGRPPALWGRPAGRIHLFGITQVSALHLKTLDFLGRILDLQLYHYNPLVARLEHTPCRSSFQTLAESFRGTLTPSAVSGLRGQELFQAWGQAGAESLWLVAELLRDRSSFRPEILADPAALSRRVQQQGTEKNTPKSKDADRFAVDLFALADQDREDAVWDGLPIRPTDHVGAAPSVLQWLQAHLLCHSVPETEPQLHQDKSLQIVACPGRVREVETVYHSILDNLNTQPDLRQTDIAVLVTDMAKYRPVIQGVFGREPRLLHYNLADFSAAPTSTFGQALLGLLDLALESFTRSRVMTVLLNPCVLARLGVERSQALTWLHWAETLNIYQGWDANDKKERGYPATPWFGWKLALQRLRLGQFMEIDPTPDGRTPRYGHVLPYADLESRDRDQLSAFCLAVEGLLPVLVKLRGMQANGQTWAKALRRLIDHFLAVPVDRPEEAQVRDQVLASLDKLTGLDPLQADASAQTKVPLALVREFVHAHLEALEGARGDYLTGGVTISALQPLRPVPFRVLYLLGLNEDLFPGSNTLTTFDLRSQHRKPGDIRPAEANRFLFLEALLAARDKIYLLYNCRDLQKDQPLHAAAPVLQLRRYLDQHILAEPFQPTLVPLQGHDERYLKTAARPKQPGCSNPTMPETARGSSRAALVSPASVAGDAIVTHGTTDRLLAVHEGLARKSLRLTPRQKAHYDAGLRKLCPDFSLPADLQALSPEPPTLSLRQLRNFLLAPAAASLKYHLRLEDEEETEVVDDEPFVTEKPAGSRLLNQVLEGFVLQTVTSGVDAAVASWPRRFVDQYEDHRLRGGAPEEAFGDLDRQFFVEQLRERIAAPGALADFLRNRSGLTFCGPMLIGESLTPIGARVRFPALKVPLPARPLPGGPTEVRLVGSSLLTWHGPGAFEILVLSSSKEVSPKKLCRPMLDPILFFLALKAGWETGPDGISSREWLGERAFHLHLAHAEGIATVTYEPGDVSGAEATAYLTELAGGLLNSQVFDLLPFEIVADKDWHGAMAFADADVPAHAVEFKRRLENAIEENQENAFSWHGPSVLEELVRARVPADALSKVRRRFHLLDRGPARRRAEATSRPKGKKVTKK